MSELHSFLNSSIYLKDKNFNLPDIENSFFVKSETIISIWSIYEKFDVVSNTKKSSWKKKTFKLGKCRFETIKINNMDYQSRHLLFC